MQKNSSFKNTILDETILLWCYKLMHFPVSNNYYYLISGCFIFSLNDLCTDMDYQQMVYDKRRGGLEVAHHKSRRICLVSIRLVISFIQVRISVQEREN